MEKKLGYIIYNNKGYSTHIDKELSNEEFNLFSNAIDELHNYESLKRLYDIVILNNNEFINFIEIEKKSLYENSISVTGDKENYYIHHLNLNRMFLNYLSSFRTLIDHIETITKKKYGTNSAESLKFKKITSNIFDKYFAYRFFCKLRNYSQHCGIPIDEFEVSLTVVEMNKFKQEYKIEFSSNDLLKKYKEWGAILKNDLKNKDKFSIFPLLDEMKLALDEFWLSIIKIYENDIQNAINFINENSGHLDNLNSTVCIFSNIKTDDYGNMEYFTSNNIPFDIIKELN